MLTFFSRASRLRTSSASDRFVGLPKPLGSTTCSELCTTVRCCCALMASCSNAARVIVGELTDSCELRVLERWSAHLRLGDSVFENGVIPENIVQQLEQTIQGLLQESQNFSQVKVSLSATSAMRDAENRTEVVSCQQPMVGHAVKILSGKEESQCLLEGVKSFLPQTLFSKYPLKQTILADLGGGSLEISLLESADKSNSSRNNFLHSFDIGTLRLKKMNPVLQ